MAENQADSAPSAQQIGEQILGAMRQFQTGTGIDLSAVIKLIDQTLGQHEEVAEGYLGVLGDLRKLVQSLDPGSPPAHTKPLVERVTINKN
jgi:hypothetical protein